MNEQVNALWSGWGITKVLVMHHTHKCYDSDPFNLVSGIIGKCPRK